MGKIYDKKYINYVGMNYLAIIDLILNRNLITLKNFQLEILDECCKERYEFI